MNLLEVFGINKCGLSVRQRTEDHRSRFVLLWIKMRFALDLKVNLNFQLKTKK